MENILVKSANSEMVKLNDLELVKLIKKEKNQEAFQEIINRYAGKIYNLSYRITRSKEDAEEALQDTFIAVFSKIDSFKEESTFSSWLYRVTSNAAFMVIRKRKKSEAVSMSESEDFTSSQVMLKSTYEDANYISTRHELQERLELAILKLPKDYSEIFIMRDVDRYSNKKISRLLNLSIPAVKAKIHRARLLLRKELLTYYEDYTTSKEFSKMHKENVSVAM